MKNLLNNVLIGIWGAAGIWILSLGSAGGYTAPTPTAPPVRYINAEREEFAFRLARSTVEVHTDRAYGSGFVIGRSGLVMTAAHVVEDSDEFAVKLWRGPVVNATLLYKSEMYDFAILSIEVCLLETLDIEDRKPAVGEVVHNMGHPNYRTYIYNKGNIVSPETIPMVGWHAMSVNIRIAQGVSGGPLVNDAGDVVGVASAGNFGKGWFWIQNTHTNKAYYAPMYLLVEELRGVLNVIEWEDNL